MHTYILKQPFKIERITIKGGGFILTLNGALPELPSLEQLLEERGVTIRVVGCLFEIRSRAMDKGYGEWEVSAIRTSEEIDDIILGLLKIKQDKLNGNLHV